MNLPVFLSPWLLNLTPHRRCSRRLMVFPFAGAGPYAFRSWVERLPDEYDLFIIQLPGRGTRMRETPFHHIEPLVAELHEAIRPYLEKPFSVLGHSMGALVSFELARRLRSSGVNPERMFVSAYPAPHIPFPYHSLHNLLDEEFIEEMKYLSGTPPAVLECRDLMQMILPALRADFELLDRYRCAEDDPFTFPIHVMGGTDDPIARPEHLEAWRVHTTSAFSLNVFRGNHFYYEQHQSEFFTLLCSLLETAPLPAGTQISRS